MILALLLFQAATSTLAPPAMPAPAATRVPVSSAPRTLADVARDRKLAKDKGEARPAGSFSAAGSTAPSSASGGAGTPAPSLSAAQADEAKAAQARMDRAVKDGGWTNTNIHYLTSVQDDARAEWDAAAENCRKTPGCHPRHRDDARDADGKKPLRTGKEVIKDIVKSGELSD